MKWSRKKRVLLAAVLAVTAALLLTAVAIVWDGLSDRVVAADVAIVLGSAVRKSGRPSLSLRSRLDKALELYQRGLFRAVLVSGGIDRAGQDEAAVMARYLVARGVPAQCILVDHEGNNTYLTARNAARIMEDHQLRSALVVSQYFHITRAKLALRHCGVRCDGWAHADLFLFRDLYSTPREVAGLYAYLFRFCFS